MRPRIVVTKSRLFATVEVYEGERFRALTTCRPCETSIRRAPEELKRIVYHLPKPKGDHDHGDKGEKNAS